MICRCVLTTFRGYISGASLHKLHEHLHFINLAVVNAQDIAAIAEMKISPHLIELGK